MAIVTTSTRRNATPIVVNPEDLRSLDPKAIVQLNTQVQQMFREMVNMQDEIRILKNKVDKLQRE